MIGNIEEQGRVDDKRLRIVVIGGGFAGLNFVKHVDFNRYSVTLIDKNNFHCFPPLFYQVASAGLDPASICFPLRRELRKLKSRNIMFNMGEVREIDVEHKRVMTMDNAVDYDILVIAAGTTNNFFNMPQLENDILDVLEKAALEKDAEVQRRMLNFVVIGGGPTGVEIAGAIGEMKRYVLPREYPTIPQENMSITLLEGSGKLLGAMSEPSSRQAARDLESLMVKVRLGTVMKGYENGIVTLSSGEEMPARMVFWTAGVTGVPFTVTGATGEFTGHGNRFLTDLYCRVAGMSDVYALGDISLMDGDPAYPKGHPQLAQVAIQQGRLVARNLNAQADVRAGKRKAHEPEAFRYKDKGAMATIGRNRAVVDMKHARLSGFSAWLAWMFVHLISLLGMRNKITVLINWIWAYFNYSTSLRLLIHPCRYPLRKRWLDE